MIKLVIRDMKMFICIHYQFLTARELRPAFYGILISELDVRDNLNVDQRCSHFSPDNKFQNPNTQQFSAAAAIVNKGGPKIFLEILIVN